jgi:uncharacterized protein YciI
MTYFAVTREAGPAWIEGKSTFEQPAVAEHTAYMNALAHEGIVRFAGPLAGTEHGRIRVLLIMSAADEDDVHRHLADDPWATTRRLVTSRIEAWNLLVGTDQLADPVERAKSPGQTR